MILIERLRCGVSTGTAEETRALAAGLAPFLPTDATLALHGDLGSGKTTFVQGLARGLGVTGSVTSPTYTVYTLRRGSPPLHAEHAARTREQSPIRPGSHRRQAGRAAQAERTAGQGVLLMHLDAYRLDSAALIDELLLDDFLVSPYCLAVEWPEKIAGWISPDAWHFDLQIVGKKHSIKLR